MRFASLIAAAATVCLLPESHGRVLTESDTKLAPRGFPANAPYGYAPQVNSCPSNTPSVRAATSLSPNETAWLQLRRNATIAPMRTLLARMNITGLDTTSYLNRHANNASALPNIGIAVSGGGYRAMLNGAGYLEAWDDRTPNATSVGQLGGLLQATTYLSGLSGGSWLVGSLYSNNFTSVDRILAQDTDSSTSGDLWQLDQTIFEGPESGGIQLVNSAGYYIALESAVNNKQDVGFDVSLTDYWGRALSYQLVNDTDGGPSYTWSSVAQQDFFTNGSVPLPLIVADGRQPGETLVPTNTTIFTLDPWEIGTFDPTIYGFAPMQYVGTNFSNGRPTSNDRCVTGFDNVGFVYGTSSSLFNVILTTVNGTNTTGLFTTALQDAVEAILSSLASSDNDIADWVNPFYNYHPDTNPYASSQQLTLVDGGEDNQVIPFHPLIQPQRHVDVVFAIDSSADTNTTWPTNASSPGWPNGASIVATYQRSLSAIQNHTAFPSIPDINTFVNLGLNDRPTFFGCDAGNITGEAPLIVYLPNAPYVYNSNVSTYDLQFNNTERNAIVLNGYNGATLGNGTLDKQWPACVGCAILSRSLNRTGTAVPEVCTQCFQRYCWNGTTNTRTPANFVPKMKLTEVKVTTSGALTLNWSISASLISLLAAVILML
ncbi:hypothetical protein BAUCODRAFT_30039 [Baudoinia panamericana UAMH 10762]|uniref:Lysophospholipase n=1 Tax=Baudoinia panamericana (strain UAMH 10762) TaxID=717646 RepID=M2N6G4_BAUPA|nr:uncharacterized protein BAUCODRAFT_30039 [Baudoinia panamericana UAMH 10762]EMC99663.1 hypothetical protein BAUCODRAFT_30039 [Baudoinia panamericana UAMH 10762]